MLYFQQWFLFLLLLLNKHIKDRDTAISTYTLQAFSEALGLVRLPGRRIFPDSTFLKSLLISGVRMWTVQDQQLSFCTGFPSGSDDKESACNGGDLSVIPGLGRSPGEGNGNLLQYSCLENSMDRGGWWATVHEVTRVRHN